MKKKLCLLYAIIVLVTGCGKVNFNAVENKKNSITTMYDYNADTSDYQNSNTTISIKDDLDNNGDTELIVLNLVHGISGYDLVLEIGSSNYNIINVCTELDDMVTPPSIRILETAEKTKCLILIYSLEKQGGTDGDYYFKLFKYVNDSIVIVNDGNISLSAIKCNKYNDHISLSMSAYNTNYKKTFDKDSGYYSMMTSTDEVSSEYRKNTNIKTTCIENIGVHDFDNDGIKEIITQNSIELEMGKTYIGSLYLLYKLGDSDLTVKKAFILDHTNIQSRIIKVVIENGYYNINNGKTDELEIWPDEDIESDLSKLVKNNILVKINDSYVLKIK